MNPKVAGDTIIVFQRDGSDGSFQTAVNPSGEFQLSLPPGEYRTSCISLSGPCRADGGADDAELAVSVRSSMTQNYTVTATAEDPTPTPEPTAAPEPTATPEQTPPATQEAPPESEAESCASQGFTVCGRVFLDGHPVRGITIEYKFRDANVSTTTDASGAYALKVPILVSHAVCLTFNFDLECGVIGSNGDMTTIQGDLLGQIVNFRVCKMADYPACLEP